MRLLTSRLVTLLGPLACVACGGGGSAPAVESTGLGGQTVTGAPLVSASGQSAGGATVGTSSGAASGGMSGAAVTGAASAGMPPIGLGQAGASVGAAGSGTGGVGVGGSMQAGGAMTAGGAAGQSSGGSSSVGGSGMGGMPISGEPGICDNGMRDGNETSIDCGGSCPACPAVEASPPDPENEDRSGCEANGNGFMCSQSMVFSPEMKQAAYADWGMDDPPFVYGVVGHDPDPGGVDGPSASYSSTCCQCYQLVFIDSRDAGTFVPPPKPMIVQAFNTYAGGPTAFDVYMAGGGHGNFNGCTENGRMYSGYPDMGGDWTGGVRATRYGQCRADQGYTEQSVSSATCQDFVATQCDEIVASDKVQSDSRQSCLEANFIDRHYHMNWNVAVKRVECPEALTRVTGCQLGDQGLPDADPSVQTAAQAMQNGFLSGDYHTTTMQDCCRPTCAWPTNVEGTTGGWSRFYVCGADGARK